MRNILARTVTVIELFVIYTVSVCLCVCVLFIFQDALRWRLWTSFMRATWRVWMGRRRWTTYWAVKTSWRRTMWLVGRGNLPRPHQSRRACPFMRQSVVVWARMRFCGPRIIRAPDARVWKFSKIRWGEALCVLRVVWFRWTSCWGPPVRTCRTSSWRMAVAS